MKENVIVVKDVSYALETGSYSSSLTKPLQALCLPTKFVARV